MTEIIKELDSEPPPLQTGESLCDRRDRLNDSLINVHRLLLWHGRGSAAFGATGLSNLTYYAKHGGVPVDAGKFNGEVIKARC